MWYDFPVGRSNKDFMARFVRTIKMIQTLKRSHIRVRVLQFYKSNYFVYGTNWTEK